MESGAHVFCDLETDRYDVFSLEQATEHRISPPFQLPCLLPSFPSFFPSFSFLPFFLKNIFLVLIKYETNRVTGRQNIKRARVENRKEGKPWRAGYRELIWQLVAAPKAA